jgi:hypothetical protein
VNRTRRTRLVLAILCLVVPTSLIAQTGVDIPNWTVPPYRQSGASSGLSPMADISPGIAFVAMTPCRVFDTRNSNGPYGGPRLSANTMRNFDVDNGPCTGIPTGVEAYSMNFGAILPDGLNSFITIWPAGSAQPLVSSINPIQGGVVANAAIVPAGTGGSISVFPNTGVHLYGDINGYFTDEHNPGQSFISISGTAAPAIIGENTSTAAGAHGVRGVITSTTPGNSSVAVRGQNNGTGAIGLGVWGSHAGGGFGVYGTSPSGFGVRGEGSSQTDFNVGVFGRTQSSATDSSGVEGHADNAAGVTYGVRGITDSGSSGSAGVLGINPGTGLNSAGVRGEVAGGTNSTFPFFPAGVRGESRDSRLGVLGISAHLGTAGVLTHPTTGAILAQGFLGSEFGDDPGVNPDPPWAVFGDGHIGATGTKYFLDPHPSDPKKVIGYISLEGPEAGTYFRGRGKFQNGLAKIDVPDHFRMVTDPEGLTVQITPSGEMATFAVVKLSLEEIVVKASRNVDFFYLVQGVRRSFRDAVPVRQGNEFRPRSADAKMPAWLSDSQKRVLIQNGTYKEDGTVNIETAERLGWDKVWEARGRPETQQPEVDEP